VNAALETYQDQLLSIRQQVPGLVAGLSDEQFRWSPGPKRWSMAQCFDHLNVTARGTVASVDAAIQNARTRGLTGAGPFAHSVFERLFIRSMEPPPGFRFRAPKTLAPAPVPSQPMAEIVREFMSWQDQLSDRMRLADGIDLQRTRVQSPASPLIAWSLGGMFALTLAHERRHLWQAGQVRNALQAAGARL
jgi:hypothetical protein